MFKKFHSDIDGVDHEGLDNYDNNYAFADDDEYRKIGSIRTLFKEFDRDYYKTITTNGGFAGMNNNYTESVSKGDRYENLSPEECLNMIRLYLRDLINEHIPTTELYNNNNNNNNNDNNDTDHTEWKIELTIQKIVVFLLEVLRKNALYTQKVNQQKFIWVVTQKMSLIHLLIHFYKDFKMHKKHQIKEEANLFLVVLKYYIIIFKE